VDLIKVFNHYGIRKFDIVPEWAKEIITQVVEVQGIGILRYVFLYVANWLGILRS
jgi:hypothetical protein